MQIGSLWVYELPQNKRLERRMAQASNEKGPTDPVQLQDEQGLKQETTEFFGILLYGSSVSSQLRVISS